VEVTVYLRRAAPLAGQRDPAGHAPARVRRQELATRHGATAADVAAVEAFAVEQGLEIVRSEPGQRRVVLAGTAAALGAAFGVELGRYDHPAGNFRGRSGPVHVPSRLADVIEGVFGLDDRPQARPRLRRHAGSARPADTGGGAGLTPLQVAQAYRFPGGSTGSGQCIGIIELGGGYDPVDLDVYFRGLGLTPPGVSAVSVDGATNSPTGDENGPDVEVMLDIEVAGAVAPDASIVVYFAPNDDRGFLDAVTTAVHDTTHRPSVISISWGAAESRWSAQAMASMDQAFQDAAAAGVTVCCASGDDGSADGVDDGLAHADFPASSPFTLACGGTRLDVTAGAASEAVWNDEFGATGGGVSDAFDLPAWQAGIGAPASANPGGRVGRGVPDVSSNADPATGYLIRAEGKPMQVGGTSAAAPLWAGLIARLNELVEEPLGYLNPQFQGLLEQADVTRDVTGGNNGAYAARSGWDACTGWGSPDGEAWAAALIY
jgi:kumamolisin